MKPKIIISPKFTFIREDYKSLLTGALMAAIGAFVTFVLENIGNIDFGQYTPFVVGFVSISANAIRKYLSEKKYVK